MADNEIRLVSKVIREADIRPALERGITDEWFVNPDAREMWRFCVEHWNKYDRIPTPVTVRDVMPGCTILNVEESYEYLLDAFVAWRRRGLTQSLLEKASLILEEEEDHEAALAALASGLNSIQDSGLGYQDIDLTRTVDDRIAQYAALRDLPGGMRGIPTGFPTIDRATLGLQAQQLVTIVATPKAGKSTLTLKIARNVWEFGKTPMVVSFEMSNPEQEARHDAMAARIAHKRLLSGEFTDRDMRLLTRHLEAMKGKHPFHLVADPTAHATVSGVAAKIATYEPDVVFVDGVYLMRDEEGQPSGSPQALTNITRGLKRLAQRMNIPIVISTQALTWKLGAKKSVTADSIGYSSSFFQDSDVILGLQYADDNEDQEERMLKVVASRACPRVETLVIWDWDNGRFEEVDGA